MSTLADPYVEGMASGWKVIDAKKLENDTTEIFDFVIIGSGAGGATAAKIIAAAGHRVAILEEGGLVTSREFNLKEKDAYLKLYQEGLTRVASQGAISIMQGRTVGGSTTINWASSFRTPTPTLEFWQNEYGVQGLAEADLRPIFDRIENDLGIAPWTNHNENNSVLRDGCERLGIPWHPIPRNVKGCWNLGYCGMGCPTNAKQSMLVSHIPSALKDGATLFHSLKARRLQWSGDKVSAVECMVIGEKLRQVTVRGKNFILSAGAIGTPGILLRSAVPDPYDIIGKRTFLHVTIFSFAQADSLINPYHGAPQSIYTDHFQWKDGPRGPMGFKLESAPFTPFLPQRSCQGLAAIITKPWRNYPIHQQSSHSCATGFTTIHPEDRSA